MDDHDYPSEIVEIDFEVGHTSIIRPEVTTIHTPPRTHDWKVYLRSADVNGDLSCLIQRCVFHLHPEYPNHKRELKATPFAIQETGYAGFHLPIEIYFKTKKELKKFRIEYDLDLHKNIDGHPNRQKESYVRKYRCTFHNPDSEFRQKILAAGGKIADSGPITSNNTDNDESDIDEGQVLTEEPVIRQSPQQKRPISPITSAIVVNNKKVKLEQSLNDTKKKQVQSVIKNENLNKTIANSKKSKLESYRSSSLIESKTPKTLPIKESNQTMFINENAKISTLSKSRTSVKLVKSQSTNDIKTSTQSTISNIKKKELASSPTKAKLASTSQNTPRKVNNKNVPKLPIKTELAVTSTVNISSSNNIKQETFAQLSSNNTSSNNTNISGLINTLKKIPKKSTLPTAPILGKRSRSSMSFLSPNRRSTRDSQELQSTLSKNQSIIKRKRSSASSVNKSNNDKSSEKTHILKKHAVPQLSNSSQHDESNRFSSSSNKSSSKQKKSMPSKFFHSPSQSMIEASTNSVTSSSALISLIDTSQPSASSSPYTQVVHNDNNHSQVSTNIDDNNCQLSNKSDSPYEYISAQEIRITSKLGSQSDQSDMCDSDTSIDDSSEDEDLPTSLTNEDLRYKLIYIYKRFQLNLLNDLIIFVRFFKRHQLIDMSSISIAKANNDMFTYDLFSLSPSHIGELANDLGYTTTTNIVDSINL